MDLTSQVVQSFRQIDNLRHQSLITGLVQTLHDYVKKVQLTEAEWSQVISFLTKTGQLCHEQRQEYILLSDVLGISMLVDEINHQKQQNQTPSTVFGPFFIDNMPTRDFAASIVIEDSSNSMPLLIRGQIKNAKGEPIPEAKINVWQTAENGMYSGQDITQKVDNLRGVFSNQADGIYALKSILPVSYEIPSDGTVGQLLNYAKRTFWRPAHIHFKIDAVGYQSLVTHLFIENDDYLQSDAVFGVKRELIVQPITTSADELSQNLYGLNQNFQLIEFDFVLTEVISDVAD